MLKIIKVINLVDSKLYTKNSKCVEIDENLNQIFIDLVLEHLQSLWDNDMIDGNFSFSRDVLLEQINDKTTMKNILNDGRDISIAKFVENTSLIIK